MLIKIVKHSRVLSCLFRSGVNLMHFHGGMLWWLLTPSHYSLLHFSSAALSILCDILSSNSICSCRIARLLPASRPACLSLPPATQDAGKMTVSRRGAAISSGIVATLKHNLHCRRNWKVNGNWECKGLSILPPPSSSWSFIYTCHLPVEFLIFSPFVHLFPDWLHHNYPTVLGSLGQSRPKCFLTSSNCCHMHPTPLCCSY